MVSLLDLLPKLSRIILGGDFNIDFTEICDVQRSLVAIFLSSGLNMPVNSPTRITRMTAFTIEYVVSNLPITYISSMVINSGLSDQDTIYTHFSASKRNTEKRSRYFGRIYSEKYFKKFKDLCHSTDWNRNTRNFDSKIAVFLKILMANFNLPFTLRPIKPKKR